MPRSRSRSRSSSGAPPRDRFSDRPQPRSSSDDYRSKKRERSRSRSRSRDRGPPRKRRSRSPQPGRPDRRRSRSVDRDGESHRRRDRDRAHDRPRERDAQRDRERDRRRDRDQDGDRDRVRARNREGRRQRSRSPRRDSPGGFQRSKRPLPSQNDAFKGDDPDSNAKPAIVKEKPNYRPSGLLAAAANTVKTHNGGDVVLKYHEPKEGRLPPASKQWRLYVFKGDEILETLDLYTQSCWLFGREASVCDCLIEHPSCSSQHAVIQFRHTEERNEYGDKTGRVKPYVMDLNSRNGTKLNGAAVEEQRYYEVMDKDVLTFGHSTREYVVQLPKP
ncbi:hypothetical protein LTR84_011859 [Exophiala bonariae]|uniref:FHA domain-containing protein n=1 Tax=Exophiala bonariae TaxID=1690606 RepID=A0AAV9NJP1_9EURO|nr:hypothetical protein LTR84_011859 [Exophiala bonariae]